MQDYKSILEPNGTYHIYNRANGNERLFVNENNYKFFLEKYKYFIVPIADTFCYCLMENHFHFLIRIKGEAAITQQFFIKSNKGSKALQGFRTLEGLERHNALSKFISRQFSHLFNTYTQAFNKQQNRKGSLFIPRFNRKRITGREYLQQAVIYIHLNPIATGSYKTLDTWKFSSYKALVSPEETLLNRVELLEWFGGRENFIYCHTADVAIDNKT